MIKVAKRLTEAVNTSLVENKRQEELTKLKNQSIRYGICYRCGNDLVTTTGIMFWIYFLCFSIPILLLAGILISLWLVVLSMIICLIVMLVVIHRTNDYCSTCKINMSDKQ